MNKHFTIDHSNFVGRILKGLEDKLKQITPRTLAGA
jgi:hypothetical protein